MTVSDKHMKACIALVTVCLIVSLSILTSPVKAQEPLNLTIKPDGSVEPSTDLLERNGATYTLKGDLFGTITVQTSYITIDGAEHTLQGNDRGGGIRIFNPQNASVKAICNVTVKNFIVMGFEDGIVALGYWGSTISRIVLTGNDITGNNVGIKLSSYERYSDNIISSNKIHGNKVGISLQMGHIGDDNGNSVTLNDIRENGIGMSFRWLGDYYSSKPNPFQMNNTIYNNNFIDNSQNVVNAHIIYDPDCANIWDNKATGNYWSNYNGTDSDGDGIGDTPYLIDTNNIDNHPLAFPVIQPSTPTLTSHPTINTGAEPPQTEPLPTTLAIASIVSIAVIGIGLLVYFKKRKRSLVKKD